MLKFKLYLVSSSVEVGACTCAQGRRWRGGLDHLSPPTLKEGGTQYGMSPPTFDMGDFFLNIQKKYRKSPYLEVRGDTVCKVPPTLK